MAISHIGNSFTKPHLHVEVKAIMIRGHCQVTLPNTNAQGMLQSLRQVPEHKGVPRESQTQVSCKAEARCPKRDWVGGCAEGN